MLFRSVLKYEKDYFLKNGVDEYFLRLKRIKVENDGCFHHVFQRLIFDNWYNDVSPMVYLCLSGCYRQFLTLVSSNSRVCNH